MGLRDLIWLAGVLIAPLSLQAGEKHALIIAQSDEFDESVKYTGHAFEGAGYKTQRFVDNQDFDKLIVDLMASASRLKRNDTAALFLFCHGYNAADRGGHEPEHYSESTPYGHGCCIDKDCSKSLSVTELRIWARAVSERGAKAVVYDGSCTGGATVIELEKIPGVCAMATTTVRTPGLTNWPYVDLPLQSPDVKNFEQMAQVAQTQIFREHGYRIYQRMYRSGCAKESMERRGRFDRMQFRFGKDLYSTTDPRLLDFVAQEACVAEHVIVDEFERLLKLANAAEKSWLHLAFKLHYADIAHLFRTSDVPFPIADFKTLDDLLKALSKEFDELNDLNIRVAAGVKKLNAMVKANPKNPKATEPVRAEVQAAHDAVTKKVSRIHPLLGLFEELECQVQRSPCRDIEI